MLYGVSDFRIVPVNLSACLQSSSLRECSAESSRARLISALLVRKRCAGHMVLPRHRRHVSMAGSLAPSEAALHSAPLRGTQLPLLISARDARTPRAVRQRVWPLRGRRLVGPPPSCRIAMRRSRRSMLATSAPPAVKDGYFQHYSGTEPFRLERFVIENICGPEPRVPARRFHAAGAVRCT